MSRPTLNELTALAAIAANRSFRKAADELGLSSSTLSHMMLSLERSLGVRLLNRTTRSVSPTEAGERLVARVRPLLGELDAALEEANELSGTVSGTLRINASEGAARVLLELAVPRFLERYPDVALDLVTNGRLVDIVAGGFDAGVRLAEAVPQDMIAVRFGGDLRFVAVASPAYLAARAPHETPDELKRHACIRLRLPSGKLYRWEFERRGHELTVEVSGALTLDHQELMLEAAARGLGIAYVPDRSARSYLERGELRTVLDDWCPVIPGLCLYYPGHRHVPGSLRAFVDVLRRSGGRTPDSKPPSRSA